MATGSVSLLRMATGQERQAENDLPEVDESRRVVLPYGSQPVEDMVKVSEPTIQIDDLARIGRDLLLPIKELIDYKGFANRIFRTYTLPLPWKTW